VWPSWSVVTPSACGPLHVRVVGEVERCARAAREQDGFRTRGGRRPRVAAWWRAASARQGYEREAEGIVPAVCRSVARVAERLGGDGSALGAREVDAQPGSGKDLRRLRDAERENRSSKNPSKDPNDWSISRSDAGRQGLRDARMLGAIHVGRANLNRPP
jgi:hypothetical protein